MTLLQSIVLCMTGAWQADNAPLLSETARSVVFVTSPLSRNSDLVLEAPSDIRSFRTFFNGLAEDRRKGYELAELTKDEFVLLDKNLPVIKDSEHEIAMLKALSQYPLDKKDVRLGDLPKELRALCEEQIRRMQSSTKSGALPDDLPVNFSIRSSFQHYQGGQLYSNTMNRFPAIIEREKPIPSYESYLDTDANTGRPVLPSRDAQNKSDAYPWNLVFRVYGGDGQTSRICEQGAAWLSQRLSLLREQAEKIRQTSIRDFMNKLGLPPDYPLLGQTLKESNPEYAEELTERLKTRWKEYGFASEDDALRQADLVLGAKASHVLYFSVTSLGKDGVPGSVSFPISSLDPPRT